MRTSAEINLEYNNVCALLGNCKVQEVALLKRIALLQEEAREVEKIEKIKLSAQEEYSQEIIKENESILDRKKE